MLHEYVKGELPVVTFAVALPLLPPKHKTFVTGFMFATGTGFTVTVIAFEIGRASCRERVCQYV